MGYAWDMHIDHLAAPATDRATLTRLKHLLAMQPRPGCTVTLSVGDETASLPDSIVVGLRNIIAALDRGATVDIIPSDRELSLRQAASVLGVSREFVRRLVAAGELGATKVGTHHRVTQGDVLAYKERRDQRRHSALSELREQSAELGAYDEPG
jgi:excisionase family DNA binding protein